jgi:hypothetical protein
MTRLDKRVSQLHRHRKPDDPELLDARQELTYRNARSYVRRLVQQAPPLSAEQRTRLAVLLLAPPSTMDGGA